MLSIIPSGSTSFLYAPQPPNGPPNVQTQHIHPDHVHFRSASMPESVYIHRVSKMGSNPPPYYPVKHAPPPQPQRRPPNSSGLRRSATNAADFVTRRHLGLQPAQMPKIQTQWGSTAELNGLAARSRTNIAAIGLPAPEWQVPRRSNISRATSFYHQPAKPMAFAPGLQLGPPRRPFHSRDVSKPLHVDCSIEYDLGAQPKIPKDSAPLLIIHPDYLKAKHAAETPRFRPYESLQFKTPPNTNTNRYDKNLTRSAPVYGVGRGLARHQSFLVTSYHQQSAKPGTARNLSLTEKEFHVSMPDISVDDEDDEELIRYHEIATMRQQKAVRKAESRPVRRGTSMAANLQPLAANVQQRLPKARLNLSAKLEAARKLSADSGALSLGQPLRHSGPSPHNYSFEFKELNEQDMESYCGKPVNVHPVRHLAHGTSATFCDSGLGTPSSLIYSGHTPELRTGSSNSHSSLTSSLSRLKTNVSGLMNGILCCAAKVNVAHLSPEVASPPRQVSVAPAVVAEQPVVVVEPSYHQPKDLWNLACNSGGSSTSGVSSNASKQSYGFSSPEEDRRRRRMMASSSSLMEEDRQSSASSSRSSFHHPLDSCQTKPYRPFYHHHHQSTAIHI